MAVGPPEWYSLVFVERRECGRVVLWACLGGLLSTSSLGGVGVVCTVD